MQRAGLVAVESLLFSVAQRHLQVLFGASQITRGDDCVLFEFPPTEQQSQSQQQSQQQGGGEKEKEEEERWGNEVQRLCTAMVREVTGRTSLRLAGEEHETDFTSLKAHTIPFGKFMADVADLDTMPDSLDSPSSLLNLQHMLEVLYKDVVSDMKEGALLVTHFPKAMCPTGVRLDVLMGKSICMRVFSSTEEELMPERVELGIENASFLAGSLSTTQGFSHEGPLIKVWIDLRVLANAISSYSTAPIESELPSQWRYKSFTLPEATEVLKIVHKALHSYWNRNPHNERTKVNAISLLSIVSGDLREYIKSQILMESSDWQGPWRMNLDHLEKSLSLIKEWNTMVRLLLKEEWKNWDGGKFHDEILERFAARLRDVIRIRQLLESASKIMQVKLQDSITPEVLFEGQSLTDNKITSEEQWAECMAKFEKEFSFLEDNLRGRVKQLFSLQQQQQQQQGMESSIRLLQQHQALLRRDGIRNGIQKDLVAIADFLIQQLEQIRGRYENNRRRTTNELHLLRISKSCQTECALVTENALKLFGMSEELDKVVEASKIILQEVQQSEQEVLTSWKQNMEQQCKKILDVADAFTIVSVDKKHMMCTLHSSVKQFMQEIHTIRSWCGDNEQEGNKSSSSSFSQLSEEAEQTISSCERLVKAATRTMQIVSNYNMVQGQIMECTRPMLEGASTHARNQLFYTGSNTRSISINNYNELEGLNMRFQNAVDAMSNDNRRIRRFHYDFISQVIALYNVDLARHMDQWRSAVDGMRSSFEDFLHTHRHEHCEKWREHLDAQIYKVLEYQYRRGLESLHEKMEEFKVELVFKQGQVHFKPTFEAMREAYYVKLREFVGVPLRFRGLQAKRESGGPYEMYKVMPLFNKERILTVHTKAMELFAKLNRVRKAFRSYVLVGACGVNGAPDVDTLVEAIAKTMKHYSEGFNVIKEQTNKLHSIDDSMKIDCFMISTIPIKATIEEQLHRLEESLINAIRKSLQRMLGDIDSFVFNASNVITRQPTTMDEVGQANKAYYELHETMSQYETKLSQLEEMNKVLRQQSGTSIDLGATKSRWEHLREAMASHHKIIDASVSKMRVSLDAMIQKHMKDGQRFASKWVKQKRQLVVAFEEKKLDHFKKALMELKDLYSELEDIRKQGNDLESKCEYFKLPPPNFQQINETIKDATQTAAMWELYDAFWESLEELRKEDWLTFRSHIYIFDDFITEWKGKLSSGEKETQESSSGLIIIKYLSNLLEEWTTCVPLLRFVRGEGMMTEHWNEMFRLLEIDKGMKSSELTFGDIIDHYKQIITKEPELKNLHARAQGEVQIRDALQDLRVWALESTFTLITPTDNTTTSTNSSSSSSVKVKLITDWKETMTGVSENQALILSLKDSPFFSHFADEINGWEVKLATLYETLTLMNTIQRKWTYLEPIFARGALPQEQARFKRVDKEFVSILHEIEVDPRVMTIGSQSDIVDRLKTILEQIERCQKSLIEYLETKRESFPRFYFISDEDMLEILGHSKNPSVIQTHLKKLFMGIHSVLFSEDQKSITHMVSADKETVKLKNDISIEEDDVEKWLIRLDACMRETLQDLLFECVKVKDLMSMETIEMYPSQILQVAQQIHFAISIENAITSNQLQSVGETLKKNLNQLTLTPVDANTVTMLKVKALILDIIHQLEIVELLEMKKVKTVKSWWWQKQLRYYISENQQCLVVMMDASFEYTYEYQGNAAKLVHTPLTDKCYLVLTKGMQLGYGGNPYGPAGTGKTESVKALGSAMGRQVLVFNCDEGIDFKAMGRIFIGIVKCGAWGCFDEFNRLKIDQLSAISQMIQIIQEAIKNGESTCPLLNRTVQVNRNSGIFVTLNPAGKGYGGRTKLPDNLKQLFREVAMSIPDAELITSTMLLSEGFTHAKSISKQIVELFRLSGQLMSRQQHYDWGLRSLKAVLRLAGSLMQTWKLNNKEKEITVAQEEEIILQSLNTNMLSKLAFEDVRVFRSLTMGIFPHIKSNDISYGELETAVKKAIEDLQLTLIPEQVAKVMQLYEALQQRMGVVLVGPSGSGKSTLFQILRRSLQSLGVEVPLHVMNPKAMPRQQLLGYMDPDTREWYDGVLSAAAREVVKCPREYRPWIICDGDIDPEWIESLNSVLDDNKLLTLPNGVRIQFGNNVNFLFETHSLTYASPATVSRMGVILLSERDIDLELASHSFLVKETPERREFLLPLINKYIIPVLFEALKTEAFPVSTTRMGILKCSLMHVLPSVNEEDFVLSFMQGICGMLLPNGAQQIAAALYEKSNLNPISSKRPLDTYYDRKKKRLVEHTADLRENITADTLVESGALIHTADIQRLLSTIKPLLSNTMGRPLFLLGPEGCGKSIVLQQSVKDFKGVRTTVLHCSAQTTSLHLIQKLEQLCTLASTNTGHAYRPKEGERLVVILKNVNLPKPDKYGTVELHAFLLQLFMYNGFYNSDLEWIGIEKIQFVASMDPTISAGRYEVTPRLLSIVSIVYMTYPSRSGILQIYTSYFSALLKSPSIGQENDYNKGAGLAQYVISVFDKIRRRFEGEEQAHCIFTPRSITKCVTNLLMYAMDTQTTTLPAVLAYESICTFADGLSRTEDRRRAEKIISDTLTTIGYSTPSKEDSNPIMFVSWFSEVDKKGIKPLKGVPYETIAVEVERALVRYSREFKHLNIHIIQESLSWLTRVDRVLSRPFGRLILVGRPGVGKRNSVCLAAYMLRMEVVTLNMVQGYNIKNFRQELRQLMQRVITQNEHLVLLLDEHNIVDERFLEMINSLVSSGEIPGLFSPEELETMFTPLREEASSEGYIGSIYSYFLLRVRRNLRVVLSMDDQHELFLVRLQSNPGLLSNCDLLWMGTWSNETARAICKKRLHHIIKRIEEDPSNKNFHLHRELFAVHEGFGKDATPGRFQILMETYESILRKKSENSEIDLKRLQAGLTKLHEAEESVEKIQKDVKHKKEQVEIMQREADNALTEIQKKMEESKEQRDSATELQERLKNEHEEIIVKRQKVEDELSGIKPSLEAAREAVNSIRSEQLNEIRSLKAPPEPVRDVLEGVLALLGVTDVSWQSMRKFLGERGAKERILDFDAQKVTPAIRENVSRLLNQKSTSFKPEVIHRASVAAAPMAAWVKAMVDYSTILERIAPLSQQLQQLEKNQKEGEEQLHVLKKKLKRIDEAVEELRKEFSKKCKEAERLKDTLEKAQMELEKACNLLEKLSTEKTRWAQDIEKIELNNRLLPKRAIISAAFMTYIAKETEDIRLRYFKQWSNRLNFTSVETVTGFMRAESDLLEWKSEGLPGDDLSQENAIAMLDAVQTPLIIDPANQAIEWVKVHLKNKNIITEVTSVQDERFAHTLELAVRFGKTLLVMDVDGIEPILYPILRKDLLSAGAKRIVQVGNKQVDWQDTFRIMLFTRRTDLLLPPGGAGLVLEVNFSVTRFGLENQLLGVTIQHERPELEEQRVELVKKEENLKLELSKLEVRLLNDLANSHGDLLENTTLISALNDIKTQASNITEALQQSRALQVELDEKRDVYRPFASKGSMIFFLVKDMEKLNRMYHFGLNDFVGLFLESLDAYKETTDVNQKISELTINFAQKCFFHVCRGLLECDRLLFGIHLIHGLFPEKFPEPLWDLLVGAAKSNNTNNNNSSDAGNEEKKSGDEKIPSWVSLPTARTKLITINSDEVGSKHMQQWELQNTDRWVNWMRESAPEETLVKNESFSIMDQLLIIDTFRPDRLTDLLHHIIMYLLHLETLVPVTSLEEILGQGKSMMPIILITSRGADPSLEVQEIAFRLVGRKRFVQIALGGGQTEDAMLHLRRCAAQGDWLFLKNLHLVLDWASVLEKELSAMPTPNPDFRLIITTEPHDLFPTVLLRMSMKVTVETPPGIKQNLLQSYTIWDESFINNKTKTTCQVLFGLAWFHAILQERRNYVPQGWLKFYEFSSSDLKSAAESLSILSSEKMDWTTVHGLLQECIYGGRLENKTDEKVLMTLISFVFNDDMLTSCKNKLYGNIFVPSTNVHNEIVQFIRDHFPDSDNPSILSLPDNAERVVKEHMATQLREHLRSFANMSQIGIKTTTETWRSLLGPVIEMWNAYGSLVETHIPVISEDEKDLDPMYVFFVSEVGLLVNIIDEVADIFTNLRSVIDGTLIPSLTLREEATELMGGRVPLRWLELMDGPREATLWLSTLRHRLVTMIGYCKITFSMSAGPFDLLDFLRPRAFLNALRIFTARTAGVPLVDLTLLVSPDSRVTHDLQVGITVKGGSIQLQGAILNERGEVEMASASSPSSLALKTDLKVGWVVAQNIKNLARIPLYTNAERVSHILDLNILCNEEVQEKLLLGGVAAFLMTV
ncbi:putative dynein heavy chain [Trypanosoma theileri]|uniref:Putative dynein heavy chain n=1 Tax=Trypanosoma theileri TaxID=67003 RepID=A0A1X0P454_9TRYP|nr:putative dynein heavy chain [Trypanosoma theileri]ORC91608.1 putative dynein heavy chain [Trypanosoma theileri]